MKTFLKSGKNWIQKSLISFSTAVRFCLPLPFFALSAMAADVQFNFSDFRGSVSAFANTNVIITIKPIGDLTVNGVKLALKDWGRFTNDTAGGVLVTGMFAGTYSCTLSPSRTAETTFSILVPDTNATLSAWTLRVTSTNSTTTGTGYAYPTSVSDAKYALKSNTVLTAGITWTNNYGSNKVVGIRTNGALYLTDAGTGSGGGGTAQNSLTNGDLYGTVGFRNPSAANVEQVRWYWPSSTSFQVDDKLNDTLIFGYSSASQLLQLPAVQTLGALKPGSVTASSAAMIGSDGRLTNSAATATELSYLSGVTSGIQAQINALGGGGGAGGIATNGGSGTNNTFTGMTMMSGTNTGYFTNAGNVGLGGKLLWDTNTSIYKGGDDPSAAANLIVGQTSVAATTNVIAGPNSSTSSKPGGHLIIAGGRSTGNGVGGNLLLATSGQGGAVNNTTNPWIARIKIDYRGDVFNLSTGRFYMSNVISAVSTPVATDDAATKGYSDQIGTDGTNNVNAAGTASTNFARATIGLASTNAIQAAGTESTNFGFTIGLAGTNNVNSRGTESTNFARGTIGLSATNYTDALRNVFAIPYILANPNSGNATGGKVTFSASAVPPWITMSTDNASLVSVTPLLARIKAGDNVRLYSLTNSAIYLYFDNITNVLNGGTYFYCDAAITASNGTFAVDGPVGVIVDRGAPPTSAVGGSVDLSNVTNITYAIRTNTYIGTNFFWDMSLNSAQAIALTNDLFLGFTNFRAGYNGSLRFTVPSTNSYRVILPSGLHLLSGTVTNTVLTNKWAILGAICYGPATNDVAVSFSPEF